ncbi:hypothetical protein E4U51_008428 [Claviceps purpurea]|nr:hypothetical protein E4U51_008428 [Claviceps purpurea]
MTAYLRKPFPSIRGDDYLDRGAGGQIFVISKRVVFKCPTKFGNPAPSQEEEMEESAEKIAHEKSTHELLMKQPHPNIVRCILCVPEGFFMERMEATLQTRIEQYSAGHVPSNRTKARWITQIASTLSWIEGLAEELEAVSESFAKLNKGRKIPHAGPITEQFALGSCIYTIRFGHVPLDGLDPPDKIPKLMNNEFPSTENDAEFGGATESCWQEQYASIAAAYDDIEARCDGLGYDTESFSHVSEDLVHDMASLVAECKDSIAQTGERNKLPV